MLGVELTTWTLETNRAVQSISRKVLPTLYSWIKCLKVSVQFKFTFEVKATEIFSGLVLSCWSPSVQQMWNAQGFDKPVINGDNGISVPEPKLLLILNILGCIFFIGSFVWVLCSALSHNLTLIIAHQVSNEVWYLLLANLRQSHLSKPTAFAAVLVYLVRISWKSCDFTERKVQYCTYIGWFADGMLLKK